jgi:hypothetical protein
VEVSLKLQIFAADLEKGRRVSRELFIAILRGVLLLKR